MRPLGTLQLLLTIICSALMIGCQTPQKQHCLQIQKTLHQPNTLNLAHYHLIHKKTIRGISNNLSALTWNKDTQTLFGTLNKPAAIVELSPDGELIRTITLQNILDTEAIEYIGNNQFIIADEQHQLLFKITLNKQTTYIDGQTAPHIKIADLNQHNKGLEGLAYDHKNKILYAANEANPIALYKITGFIEESPVTITEVKINWSIWLDDISGLHFYQPAQHLLVLSDESKLILALDSDYKIIGCISLIIGQHGLLTSIRQPEGITMDDHDNLYIVSEPNLFYKFSKP